MRLKFILFLIIIFFSISALILLSDHIKILPVQSHNILYNPVLESVDKNPQTANTPQQIWESYTNPFNTYTLKYPQSWNMEQQNFFAQNNIDLLASDLTLTINSSHQNKDQIIIHDFNQLCLEDSYAGYEETTQSNVYINNHPARKYQSQTNELFITPDRFLTIYILQNKTTCLEISTWQSISNQNNSEINEILGSLKF